MTKNEVIQTIVNALLAGMEPDKVEVPKKATKKKAAKKTKKKPKAEPVIEDEDIEEIDDDDLDAELEESLEESLEDSLEEEDEDEGMSQDEFEKALIKAIKAYKYKGKANPKRARAIIEKYKKENKLKSILDAKPSTYSEILELIS